jgi:transcriptional regulator with XRE-family HTH domain
MSWSGSKIKDLSKAKKISLTLLGTEIGVTRQTINDWIKGQVPKGNHLLSLCKIFGVNPNYFFEHLEEDLSVVVPVHRMRGTAKMNKQLQKESENLAGEYKIFFKNFNNSFILPVIRAKNKNESTAKAIADKLRSDVELQSYQPINYSVTFSLMERLGIFLILREFPESIKSYAFFTKIYGNRVVFVNTRTNVIDLIFPLLHEIVHAIQDDSTHLDESEEMFCDHVASYIQFTDDYAKLVYEAIKDVQDSIKVNKLKTFAIEHSHSLFGIVKRIKKIDPKFTIDEKAIGGANTNLKKQFPTLKEILFSSNDPRNFVELISELSPLFFKALVLQLENITDRKFSILLDLENQTDVQSIKTEFVKFAKLKESLVSDNTL